MDSQARDIGPGEMRLDAEKKLAANPNDAVTWLGAQRDFAAADAKEAFAADDKVKANTAALLAETYSMAADELAGLRERTALAQQLLVSRLIVALADAKAPAWTATHRHYKGTLYRVTGRRSSAEHEELEEGVEYDDAEGNRFWLPLRRWQGTTESGKPRYQAIIPGDSREAAAD